MTIDEYLTGIERGLRENVHMRIATCVKASAFFATIMLPTTLSFSPIRIISTLGQLTGWLRPISRL